MFIENYDIAKEVQNIEIDLSYMQRDLTEAQDSLKQLKQFSELNADGIEYLEIEIKELMAEINLREERLVELITPAAVAA